MSEPTPCPNCPHAFHGTRGCLHPTGQIHVPTEGPAEKIVCDCERSINIFGRCPWCGHFWNDPDWLHSEAAGGCVKAPARETLDLGGGVRITEFKADVEDDENEEEPEP